MRLFREFRKAIHVLAELYCCFYGALIGIAVLVVIAAIITGYIRSR